MRSDTGVLPEPNIDSDLSLFGMATARLEPTASCS